MSRRPPTSERQRVNKQCRDLQPLFRPILRAIGADALTLAEVIARVPQLPAGDVRRALLVLHGDGALGRLSDPQCVLYYAADSEASS